VKDRFCVSKGFLEKDSFLSGFEGLGETSSELFDEHFALKVKGIKLDVLVSDNTGF
jgi:hypothetical protein